ncbi:MAG TPA: methyltransferase domain-containing protein [Anaerolineae bacterium]|nr:methyltransferase domain-containing protein [Anaerolineae bacterium]
MPVTAQPFDANVPAWKEGQNAPWGRLRYNLTRANLSRHLPDRPLRILDAGGGNGLEAIEYAQQGHAVTLVDFSDGMLAEAHRVAEAQGVADRITFHRAELTSIPALFPEPGFDLALCHNVVQYVDDAAALLRAVCHPLKVDGLLSLIGINRYSELYRLALMRLDLAGALISLDATTAPTLTFGVPMRLYTIEELREPLHSAGCAVVGQYGTLSEITA